jgi:3-hydroxyacyl-CoA dehydrogenase
MSEAPVVRFDVEDGVGVITVDNPPVNALGPGVREGIIEAVAKGIADPKVTAMVLMGAGRSFIAGADIRQFGRPRSPVTTRQSAEALESSPKPVVAAIHGFALGGGLEHALACNYRVAVPSAKVGLPEVLIGILPGGGGTQRLPRLIGPKAALDMIVTGRHVPAEEAKKLGILDEIVDEKNLRGAAIRYARSVVGKPLTRVRDRTDRLAEAKADPGMFEAMRKSIARKARNQKAPYNCIACVEAATTQPFEEGLDTERRLFAELENADEARALRYAFFAEREVAKIPGAPADLKPPKVKTAAVIGAGTMGGGIAMSFADNGIPVKVLEVSREALDKGMQKVRDNYAVSVKRGSLAQAEMDKRLPLIQPVERYEDIADCDVVIEAVFERIDIKKDVFGKLDAVMKPGALLLTNSSAIDTDIMGNATKRPQDVAGAHFFAPANVMKLFEVVKGTKTSVETIAGAMKVGRDIGKISAVAGTCDGFVANRSRAPFVTEMMLMVEEGVLPEQVDKVMVDFGYPMGPFAVSDLSGLDISYDTRKRRAAADPNFRKLHVPDRLVEMGRKGQKTGAGWYRYEKGDRTPHPDEVVKSVAAEVARELGITQRTFTDEEILRRLLYASVNEACKILEEGRAYRASDIDVMWLHGFGFPRYRGGIMFWADTVGSKEVGRQIEEWHQRYGARWKPSALLLEIAAAGESFRDAKPKRPM